MKQLFSTRWLLVVGLFVIGLTAHAQGPDPVQFIVAPELPGPSETVLIEAQGVGTFLGDAELVWQKDGKTEKSGRGERTYSFVTGALGSVTRINIVITSATAGTITRDFIFRPSVVNLVWEADTYTPPFYRGKALYTAGSPLKVIAFPTVVVNGSAVAASSLSFQWRQNGEPVPSASGLGRYLFSFDGDQLRQSETIGVEVFWGTTKVARGEITIPATQPLVLLYSRDPLRGVLYDTALPQAIALLGKEITLQAEPYFFSSTSKNNRSLSYVWTLNGSETTGPDTSRGILTLRQTGGGSGSAALSVSVKDNDTERLIQEASTNLQIVFGQQQSSDLFSNLSAAVANFDLAADVWQVFRGLGAPTSQQQGSFQFCQGGQCTYTPLEPLPGAPQLFGDTDSFKKLLDAVFRMLIAAGALFAVVMITTNGVRYMLSDVVTDKGLAKKRIETSLWGLLLLITAWLILFTINPNLLKFNLNLQTVTLPQQNTTTIATNPSPTTAADEYARQLRERREEPLSNYRCLGYANDNRYYNENLIDAAAEGAKGILSGLFLDSSTFSDLGQRANLARISAGRCSAEGFL